MPFAMPPPNLGHAIARRANVAWSTPLWADDGTGAMPIGNVRHEGCFKLAGCQTLIASCNCKLTRGQIVNCVPTAGFVERAQACPPRLTLAQLSQGDVTAMVWVDPGSGDLRLVPRKYVA